MYFYQYNLTFWNLTVLSLRNYQYYIKLVSCQKSALKKHDKLVHILYFQEEVEIHFLLNMMQRQVALSFHKMIFKELMHLHAQNIYVVGND